VTSHIYHRGVVWR